MTDDRMTDEETSGSDARVGKFFTDVGVIAEEANQAGACRRSRAVAAFCVRSDASLRGPSLSPVGEQ
jgi:hypothetical protein